MRARIAACVASSIVVLVSTAQTSESFGFLQDGFLTGEEFLALTANAKAYYVTGAVDGMLLAPVFGAPDTDRWLVQCISGKSNTQLSAILEKHLNANPERWHESVHASFYNALVGMCPRGK